MTNSASVTLVTPKELEQLFQKHGDLKTGDRLEAKVLKVKPDGKAQVDFGKFKAEVDLKVPVKEGDVVRLVVVEKAKQLKLKVEHVEPRSKPPPPQQAQGGEVKEAVKQVDVRQQQAINDLRTKIDRLIQKAGKAPASPEEAKQVEARAKELGRELVKVKEQLQSTQTGDALPKEVKRGAENLLDNAVNALRKVSKTGGDAAETAQKMEALAKAVRNLRTTLESGKEFQELKETIVKEIKQLQEMVEKTDIPLRKDVQQAVAKLAEAADRVSQLKQPDQLPQLRRIVADEIKPNLSRMQNALEDEVVVQGSEKYRLVEDLGSRAENLRQEIDLAMQRLPQAPDARPPEVAEVIKEIDVAVTKLADLPEGATLPRLHKPPPAPPAKPEAPAPPEPPLPDVKAAKEDILIEAARTRESVQPTENRQPVPPQTKPEVDALMKRVETAVQKTPDTGNIETSQRLENLFRAVRNFRVSVDKNRDLQELRDTIVKEVSRLKEQVEKADLPPEARKEVQEAIAKLSEAAEKIAELKRPDQLPELRKVIAEEVRPRLQELGEVLQKHQVEPVQQQVENLEREIDITLRRPPVPPKEMEVYIKAVEHAVERVETAPPPEEAPPRDIETLRSDITREVAHTREQLPPTENRQPIPPETKPEAEAVLKKVESSLQNIPETDRVETSQRLENLFRAVRNFRVSVDNNRDLQELRDTIVKEVSSLKEQVEKADLPPEARKEVQEAIAKLSEAAEKIAELKRPDQLPELRKVIAEEVRPRLQELGEVLQKHQVEPVQQQVENLEREIDITLRRPPVPPKEMEVYVKAVEQAVERVEAPPPEQAPPRDIETIRSDIARELAHTREQIPPTENRQPIPPETKPEAEAVLKRVESSLQNIPETDRVETSRQLENLFRAVRNFRVSVDNNRDLQELRDTIVKEVSRLKEQVEKADLPPEARKEVQEAIAKLSEAAEKIAELKRPHQLPELRKVIAEEVRPRLQEVGEVLQKHQVEPVQQQVENLEREIDITLRRPTAPPKEMSVRLQEVEQALSRVMREQQVHPPAEAEAAAVRPEAVPPEVPRFSESIQDIYNNIKAALRLLQSRLQASDGKVELPEDIRQVFRELQSDLKVSEASDGLMKQVTQLKALVESAGLPQNKVVQETLNTLEQLMARLNQLKSSNSFEDLQNFIRKELQPTLNVLGEIFKDPALMEKAADPPKLAGIMDAVRTLQTNSESVLSAASEKPIELSQLSDLSQRLASLPKVMQGAGEAVNPRTSENIANLANSIEELLARFPDSVSDSGSASDAAMPAKIRSLLSTLKNHLEPLDIGDSALKLVPKLKSLVKDSGVFFEKKLGETIAKLSEASDRIRGIETLEQLPQLRAIIENDMKPNLLQLRDFLGDQRIARQLQQLGEAHTLDTIRNAVEELLANIGTQQERAVEGQQSQNPVQAFSFHLPIKDEEPAELKVFYNRGREKESPDEYKLSLFLDMSRLGEVRTDFYHLKDELNITFYVKDDKVKDHLDENLDEIQEVLEPVFPNLNVHVLVSREKIADFDTAADEAEAEFISDKAVNVKV